MSCEATNLVFYVQSTSTGISGRGERERSTIIIQKSCDTDKYRRMAENRGIVGRVFEWNIGERAGRQKLDTRNEWKGWSSFVLNTPGSRIRLRGGACEDFCTNKILWAFVFTFLLNEIDFFKKGQYWKTLPKLRHTSANIGHTLMGFSSLFFSSLFSRWFVVVFCLFLIWGHCA